MCPFRNYYVMKTAYEGCNAETLPDSYRSFITTKGAMAAAS